jgi:triacylglycerol lipase
MRPVPIRSAGVRRVADVVLDYAYAIRVHTGALVKRSSTLSPDGDLAPVLVIPGVYEPWQFMRPVAERLAAAGHPVHILEPLGYNRRSIPASAALAQHYLDSHDLRDVVIVGHSKGGLIAKHMMVVDDVDGRVDRLVAISTPFLGSSMSRFMIDPALRAFMPGDKTVAMLLSNAEANSRIVSIFGEFDPEIPGGSLLPGAARNLRMPITGHFRILADRRVLDEVERAVDGTP